MKLETVKLGDLTCDPANVRRHDERNIETIKGSLARFGLQKPIVVDGDNVVRAGNGTVAAARALGWETIVAYRTELAGVEAAAFSIADNRTAELAEWDTSGLAEVLAGMQKDEGFDHLVAGFTDGEIDALIADATAPSGDVVEDDVPAIEENPITRTGDLWLMGEHRVLCGDSVAATGVPKGHGSSMLLTDPPYCSGGFQEAGKKAGSVGTRGTETIANDTLSTRGYMALIQAVIQNFLPHVVYIFTDWRMWVNLFDVVERCGFGVRNMIVWDKGTPGMGRGWRSQHELIMCGSRVTLPFDPHKAQGNVIGSKRTGNVNHATEKPVDLLCRIMDVTDVCKSVCDPFLGSGTTLIAAEQLNRKCYGIDIEPRYVDVTCKRWMNLTGESPIRESDGAKFAELLEKRDG